MAITTPASPSVNRMMVESLYADLPASIYIDNGHYPPRSTRGKIVSMLHNLADAGLLGINPVTHFFLKPPCKPFTSVFINCNWNNRRSWLLNYLEKYIENVRILNCPYYGLIDTAVNSVLKEDKLKYFNKKELPYIRNIPKDGHYVGGEIKMYTCKLPVNIMLELEFDVIFHVYVLHSTPVEAKNFLRELILLPKVIPGLSTNDFPVEMLTEMSSNLNASAYNHPVFELCKPAWVITGSPRNTFLEYSKIKYEKFILHKRNNKNQNLLFKEERKNHYRKKWMNA